MGAGAGRAVRCLVVALAIGSPLPLGAAPRQVAPGQDLSCKFEPVFRTPLHMLWLVPMGVHHVIVDGRFELIPPRHSGGPDRFYLRDDRDLGARIELVPMSDFDASFRSLARSLLLRQLEITGCLGDAGGRASVLPFYSYAVIPERDPEVRPRDVELEALRDGAYEGRRVRIRGVLAGREHPSLPISTRLSDSDWVLASDGAAAWMRGHAPEGEGFRLDPDDGSDEGRGLAVVGQLTWWRGAPVVYVESVWMGGARGRSPVAVLFALPQDGQLDGARGTIEIQFNAAMDEKSFDQRVELVSTDGQPVPVRWGYDAAWWRLRVSPREPLAAGAELELRLHEGVVSEEGWGVRRDPAAPEGLIWARRFRTAPRPPPPTEEAG